MDDKLLNVMSTNVEAKAKLTLFILFYLVYNTIKVGLDKVLFDLNISILNSS